VPFYSLLIALILFCAGTGFVMAFLAVLGRRKQNAPSDRGLAASRLTSAALLYLAALAAVSPSYLFFSRSKQEMERVASAIERYKGAQGAYPSGLADLALPQPWSCPDAMGGYAVRNGDYVLVCVFAPGLAFRCSSDRGCR
jgi:hypothetical protein